MSLEYRLHEVRLFSMTRKKAFQASDRTVVLNPGISVDKCVSLTIHYLGSLV
jgi:hypothetical protein